MGRRNFVNESGEENKKKIRKAKGKSITLACYFFSLFPFGKAENYMKNSSRPHRKLCGNFKTFHKTHERKKSGKEF